MALLPMSLSYSDGNAAVHTPKCPGMPTSRQINSATVSPCSSGNTGDQAPDISIGYSLLCCWLAHPGVLTIAERHSLNAL